MAADLDAERSDLADIGEIRSGSRAADGSVPRPLREHGVAAWITQAHVNARRPGNAMTGDAVIAQGANHGFLKLMNVFLDTIPPASAAQIDQRVSHHLTGAVVSHLPPAVGSYNGNAVGLQDV
ncbi:MAG: hypothetical protein ABS45_09410 [Comamonas sp. SCN 65-56]|nr:MAG: hypothetical protein ABS45_09410 [Comamonas sp. SCN 65-56]